MSLTVSEIVRTTFGTRRAVLASVTFDSSYPTGGEALVPADFSLQSIDAIFVGGGAAAAGSTGVIAKYDKTNQKLQAFRTAGHTPAGTVAAPTFTGTGHTHVENAAGSYTQSATTASGTEAGTNSAPAFTGTAVVAAALAEVANAVSLSTVVVDVLVIGV